MDYDLEVFGYQYNGSACALTLLGSSSAGGSSTDQVSLAWRDRRESSLFGACISCDDSRDLLIRVSVFSGNTCSSYNLAVIGNVAVANPPGGTCGSCNCEGLGSD